MFDSSIDMASSLNKQFTPTTSGNWWDNIRSQILGRNHVRNVMAKYKDIKIEKHDMVCDLSNLAEPL